MYQNNYISHEQSEQIRIKKNAVNKQNTTETEKKKKKIYDYCMTT